MSETELTADPHVDPLNAQHELQVVAYGIDPGHLLPEERHAFFLWNCFAFDDEVHEAGAEISWKPWASGQFFNRDAYIGELVDAFHFFLNLLLIANVPWDEFIRLYDEKRRRNLERQVVGYDGKSNKCPNCKRDLTDVDKARQAALTRTLDAGHEYRGSMPGDRVFTPDGATYCSQDCADADPEGYDETTDVGRSNSDADNVAWPQGTPEEALEMGDCQLLISPEGVDVAYLPSDGSNAVITSTHAWPAGTSLDEVISDVTASTHDPETGAPVVTDNGHEFSVSFNGGSEGYTIPKFTPAQKDLLLQLIDAASSLGKLMPPMSDSQVLARAERIHRIEDLKNMIEVLSQ